MVPDLKFLILRFNHEATGHSNALPTKNTSVWFPTGFFKAGMLVPTEFRMGWMLMVIFSE